MTKTAPAESADNQFKTLAALDVGDKIEKKGQLSYLSWAWAVDVLLRHDPKANWEYHEPQSFGQTMMVFCSVTAFNKTMTAQLPVMDNKNKAISNPDAFAVNTAMQRCLVKAIALHGLGLYIYAGEDLPPDENGEVPEPQKEAPAKQRVQEPVGLPILSDGNFQKMIAALGSAETLTQLTDEQAKMGGFFAQKAAPTKEQDAALAKAYADRQAFLMNKTLEEDEIPY